MRKGLYIYTSFLLFLLTDRLRIAQYICQKLNYKEARQVFLLFLYFSRLKQTPDFHATEFDTALSNRLHKILAETAKPNTPAHLSACMRGFQRLRSFVN